MAHPAPTAQEQTVAPITLLRGLSLTDSVLLMVGGIIGSGIFLTAGPIADAVRTPLLFLGVWLVGGLISLLACFAFAEMGAMYPEAGGQYVFLREAFGEFPAFLYGWLVFAVIQSGSIAALAVGFADYLGAFFPAVAAHQPIVHVGRWTLTRGDLVGIAAIVLLTVVNVVGLKRGSALINIATWAKFVAIGVFVLLGLAIGHGHWSNYSVSLAAGQPFTFGQMVSGLGVALIGVFWAFDGWVYVTWVAGEIKEPQRVLPRAMVLGVLLVAVIYLLINAVYLYALPITEVAKEETIARAAAVTLFSSGAGRWLSGMIALSCFGALSCMVLSGGRVPFAMARDRAFFHSMGRLHPRYRTPAVSLIALSALGIVFALSGTFDQLYTYVMFMQVVSYAAAVVGLFVLRRTQPDVPRPYRCTGYPYLPALYVIFAGVWALNSVVTRPRETLIGIGIAFLGAPLYFFWRRGAGCNTPLDD
ncbi:MAG TPA: amino acid permease [Candidatus Bathyarchaeia archaeon]|nr:amino acid permease [Candidatus Bathyarchaeia archaeon]